MEHTIAGESDAAAQPEGHPALSLCNAEDLSDYVALLAWARQAGLITDELADDLAAEATRQRAQASHIAHEARNLREAIRDAVTDPARRTSYHRITRLAHQAYADAVLLPGAPARWELGRALETPLYAAALAAVDLLTEVDLRTIRTCLVHGCGALFLAGSQCRRHPHDNEDDLADRVTQLRWQRAIA